MTNEQIAISIYTGSGNSEQLLSQLWGNIKRLAYKHCNRYYLAYADAYKRRGVTVDDLMQECYFALLDAVKYYGKRGGKYKFTTFFGYTVRNRITRCGSCKKDAITKSESIDSPLPGTDDFTVADTIADDYAADEFSKAEDKAAYSGIFKELKTVLSDRPEHYSILYDFYGKGLTMAQMSKERGCSAENIRSKRNDALRRLRHSSSPYIKELRSEIIGKSYTGSGLGSWKRTRTSSTERTALKLYMAAQ